MSELKPCPFCGGEAELDWAYQCGTERQFVHDVSVCCTECNSKLLGVPGATSHALSQATKEWNTRHIPEGYALVPLEPSDKMVYATELETELGAYCTSSRQSMQHSIARQVYKAMIQAAKEE